MTTAAISIMLQYFSFIFLILSIVSLPPWVACQRPLLFSNHSIPYNAIQQNNFPVGGKQLRNGRNHDSPILPQPTMTSIQLQRGMPLYDEYDSDGSTRLPPPYGGGGGGNNGVAPGRRDNRRRLSLANLGGPGPRLDRGNGRRGIDSLRKELMKPSVGGPGGGITSGSSSGGYPSYSATSSIGKISGLGSLMPADRYGDPLKPEATRFPPGPYVDKPLRPSPKKPSNSISQLMKMNIDAKAQRLGGHNQADEPVGGVTNGNLDDTHETQDPIEAIKDKIRNTEIKGQPYETQTETTNSSEIEDQLGVKCTFERPCAWEWTEGLPDGFQVITGTELSQRNMTGLLPGPVADSVDDAMGHFLYARLLPSTAQVNLTSPQFSTTMEKCFLEVYMHQSDMSHGLSRVVVEPLHTHESSWVPAEVVGDNYRQWDRKVYRLGRISRDFRIVFEIVPKLTEGQKAHVAIDNLRMVNCFPEGTKSEKCSTSQIKCMMNKVPVCIPLPRICDITKDCDDAEDELLNCDQIPYGGRCDFENDWCGWHDSGRTILSWSRHTGSSPTHDTGPNADHTYEHLVNTSGYYMLVNMNQHINNSEKGALIGFASNAIMISKTFNPPPLVHGNPNSPYRNSCVVRFYIHQFGKNPGSINLSVVEMKEKENITTTLWWSTKNQGSDWLRAEYVLPNITSKYYLQFEARMGMRIYSDVAVDDFSLSPECFGINIPEEYLDGYNYWTAKYNLNSPTHDDFKDKNYLELTTCDTRGMIGPSQQQCESSYKANNKTHILKEVRIVEDESTFKGMHKWKVPHEGHYTIIAKGAGGGLGSGGVGSSRGAVALAVLELHKDEELYMLVGQQGESACIKSMSVKEQGCGNDEEPHEDLSQYSFSSKQHMVKNIVIENGAGGGGGGTFVFLLNSAKNEAVPLIVAGGGGGLGIGQYIDEDFQHGQKAIESKESVTGQIHGDQLDKKTAGPGGGWRAKQDQALSPIAGAALMQGARGGHSCYVEIDTNGSTKDRHGQGGFGGGGGGCNTGGGGGGFAGGDVYLNESNGQGGTSFISTSRTLKQFNKVYEGANNGPGSVIVIPEIEGCGCDYRCIALDEYRSKVRCICPEGHRFVKDSSTQCEAGITDTWMPSPEVMFSVLVGMVLALFALVSVLIWCFYKRFKTNTEAKKRSRMLLESDMQLNRLRSTLDDSNLTNFNPNYGCDGILNGQIDVNSLPQVARDSLRLVKALGQGAFGEVYQGLYRHRDGDAVEMPVAVKTLPEMSTKQAEEDFLMEAAIMAKFNHPNMVHLIGVCFDRHPRFIVLELLAGGDLKNFLREGRSKPDRPSALNMKDLVFCALDVAKGCRYMESKRFIHRDIAARNCLLSSKGPGRVVKIADFGMARDIYRSDYYRKGGKAMLPIKWMPPEAFLDGIFTSKTDVWSFGVLLWEVFSLGLMPYTGLPNPEVMQLVTNGGRLGSPPGCPPVIYRIMADCWNPTPEDRPTFSTLLERLTACTQDAEVMNAPLPFLFRPPSCENDQTIMRPPGGDDFCLQVPNSSDYLIPLPGIRNGGDYAAPITGVVRRTNVASTSTACTPPAVASPSTPLAHPENDDEDACWETSFIMPSSKSDQPLLGPGGAPNGSQRSINGVANSCAMANNTTNNNNNNNNNINNNSGSNSSSQRSPMNARVNNSHGHGHGNANANTNDMNMVNGGCPSDSETNNKMVEGKLISLDTPQPTPTTVQPPLSFSSQLEGITLDPAALAKSMNSSSAAAASKQSYANIQMMTTGAPKPAVVTNGPVIATVNNCTDAHGQGQGQGQETQLPNGNANVNGNGMVNGANGAPFTISGYGDRYKDNHSEISC